jgi:hypothetical protein
MGQPPRAAPAEGDASEEDRVASHGQRSGRPRRPRSQSKPERKPSRRDAPATVTRLDEARSRRAPKPAPDTGHGHLPAFLLRPVRIKA